MVETIPGKHYMALELPNPKRQVVALREILADGTYRKSASHLTLALGKDIMGTPVVTDLAKMPHLLIAGATGAGKSSCLNSLLTSVLMRSTPDQVRMILVDPKRVEMGQYDRLPHLLTQVVVDPKKAANALAWAVTEMERRYDLLARYGVRDITGYNQAFERGELENPQGVPDAVRSARVAARARSAAAEAGATAAATWPSPGADPPDNAAATDTAAPP